MIQEHSRLTPVIYLVLTLNCDLRQYPSQLGDAVHQIYMEELSRPVVGSLRVNLTPSMEKTAVQLFDELPMGDVWKDACLLPVFEYLYFCRHTRTVDGVD